MAQDDVLENSVEEPVFKADDYGFNAINLRQSRFMYEDRDTFNRRKFYDHTSIGVVWHYDKIHERIPQGYEATLNYGLFVEKEFSKRHALRLQFHGGAYQQNVRPIRINKYQLELKHSFYWTRYFGGYNPYRKLEAVTNLGLGAFYSERENRVEIGPMLLMGAGARIQLNPLMALGFNPYIALVGDNVDHSDDMNHRKYDMLYGGDISLSYTYHDKHVNAKLREKYKGSTFVDFGLGLQLEPYTGFHFHTSTVPFLETPGPQLKLGIGHWMIPGVGLRATANLSSSNWDNVHIEADPLSNHPAYDIRMKNVLANGRLDLLLSPYRLFVDPKNSLFDINAIVGWEYGWMIKTAYEPINLLSTYYDGFSGGLQLRYNYDQHHTSLYLEPRLTLAKYSIPYNRNKDRYVSRYRDYLFSMTAGLEFSTNKNCFLPRKRQPSGFHPHFSLSLQGGPNYMFVTKEYAGDFYIDYSTGISGELQMTPYSGVRVMADYSLLSNRDIYHYSQRMIADENIILSDTALCTGKYGFMNFSADYVFDLGTLLQGYDENKRWDVAIAVGPVYSRRVRDKTVVSKDEMLWEFRGDNPIATIPIVDHSRIADYSWGVQLGIPVNYRINSRWDVFFEPRARFFPSDYVEQTHSQGKTKLLNTHIGLRYTFNERYSMMKGDSLSGFFKLQPGHFFAHMGVGAQSSQSWGDMGPRVEAGLGYWFNPGVAARALLNFTSHNWKRFQSPFENSLRQVSAGGRLDLMLAPFDYIANRYDRLFGINFIFGWEYGKMLRGNGLEILNDNYNTISGGFQLRYNDDSHHALYAEPRYTYNLTSKSSYYSLVVGMELGATEYAFHSNKYQPGEFSPSLSFSLLGGLGYIYNGKEYTDAPISDYTGGIAAEYKFSPYSGVRLTTNYTDYHQRELYPSHGLYNYSVDYMNFSLDYMFDVATLLQGYADVRRWNAVLAVGPTLGYKVSASESIFLTSTGKSYGKQVRSGFWGIQMGVPVSYNIDDNWSIMLEPRLKASGKHLFNKQTSYPFMQYDALIGVRYTLRRRPSSSSPFQ